MAFQWYRRDPETGQLVWFETETDRPPGPEWTASDVPLFDSDLARPERRSAEETWQVRGTWTVREDPPVQLERHRATGLFQGLPPEALPWDRMPKHRPDAEYAQAMLRWYLKRYQPQAMETTWRQRPWSADQARQWETVYPVSMMGAPPRRPSMRRFHERVHRLSSGTRVPRGLPRRSGLRLAGHRPLTSGTRR